MGSPETRHRAMINGSCILEMLVDVREEAHEQYYVAV
jgi:hypothetical protein